MHERIRLTYQLPTEPHDQLQGWQRERDGVTRFPNDRAEQERRNREEFQAKARAGRISRRIKS